jgi:hypothetical protein
MAEHSLSRALKIKNRQVKLVNQLKEQIGQYNSVIKGSDKPFDIVAKFAEYEAALLMLAKIKAAIQAANGPIHEKIYEMAELRGALTFLQHLDTKGGKNVYGYQGELVDYDAAIDAAKADEIRQRIEERLDLLQDEVDGFNVKTKVELPE